MTQIHVLELFHKLLRVSVVAFLIVVGMHWIAVTGNAASRTPSWGNNIKARGQERVSPRRVSTKTVPQVKDSRHGKVPARPAPGRQHARVPAPSVKRISLSKRNLTINTSFEGQSNTGWAPSDSNGAAGLYNYIETVNEQFEIYSRDGTSQYGTSFNAWYGQSGSLFDPKVIWDDRGERFIFLVDTGSSLLVSVAQQVDGIGNYCSYAFPTLANYFADYPQLGVDRDGIYFSANMYPNVNGDPFTSELFFANRGQMESCQTTQYNFWTNLNNPDGSAAFAIVPAVEHTPAGNVEYLVNSYPGGGCQLTLWQLSSDGSLSNVTVTTQCYGPPPPAAQVGSSGTIETLDNRLYQASYLDGTLVLSTVGSYDWGDGNGQAGIVEWFEINPSVAQVIQQGAFGAPGYWLFFPAMEQNTMGRVVFVFNTSGPNNDPSIWTVSDCLCDTAALASGSGYYGTNGTARWGDYQSAWLDPKFSTGAVFITGQYANGTNSWSTRIGRIVL